VTNSHPFSSLSKTNSICLRVIQTSSDRLPIDDIKLHLLISIPCRILSCILAFSKQCIKAENVLTSEYHHHSIIFLCIDIRQSISKKLNIIKAAMLTLEGNHNGYYSNATFPLLEASHPLALLELSRVKFNQI
jgi:hypothetical protein